MARFSTPQDAILDTAELHEGETVYSVCGIWPPQCSSLGVIIKAPHPFSQNKEYEEIHEHQKNLLVFNVDSDGFAVLHFCRDCNIDGSHNDNYLFHTEEAAIAARDFLRECWINTPNSIAEEISKEYKFDDGDW